MRQVLAQYLPTAAGAVMMSSTPLVDQAMAAMMDPGSVAALNYGNKIVALIMGVGSSALATTVLPYFSKMVEASDWKGLRHSLRTYIRLILFLTIPFTLFCYMFSRQLIGLLYQRGAFTSADTLVVSQIQALYVLQVPFHTVGVLVVRCISSLKANRILMWSTAISCVLNVSLDYALMQKMGIAGIALSTALVYVCACSFVSFMLYRTLKRVEQGTTTCA
jgi:putative peptidoglycan lipid II flippase